MHKFSPGTIPNPYQWKNPIKMNIFFGQKIYVYMCLALKRLTSFINRAYITWIIRITSLFKQMTMNKCFYVIIKNILFTFLMCDIFKKSITCILLLGCCSDYCVYYHYLYVRALSWDIESYIISWSSNQLW